MRWSGRHLILYQLAVFYEAGWMLKRIIGMLLIVFILCILFIDPVRNFMNKLFHKSTTELSEQQIIGTVSRFNPRVEEIQQILIDANFDPGSVDGLMGAQTRRAIRDFQKAKGLKPTGKIDTATQLAFNREKEVFAGLKKEDIEEPVKSQEDIQKIMVPRADGIKVEFPKDRKKQIQLALKNAGFYKGKIDGKFGQQTKKSIITFQKSKGLKPDGVVGKKTWEELSNYLGD